MEGWHLPARRGVLDGAPWIRGIAARDHIMPTLPCSTVGISRGDSLPLIEARRNDVRMLIAPTGLAGTGSQSLVLLHRRDFSGEFCPIGSEEIELLGVAAFCACLAAWRRGGGTRHRIACGVGEFDGKAVTVVNPCRPCHGHAA